MKIKENTITLIIWICQSPQLDHFPTNAEMIRFLLLSTAHLALVKTLINPGKKNSANPNEMKCTFTCRLPGLEPGVKHSVKSSMEW